MAGKKIYSCILLFAIIVHTSNQQCQGKHFVLVHGAGIGAWCWYKVQPLLEAAGHNVTSLDMAASGIDRRSVLELRTFEEYDQPLLDFLESIPENEKVILVGHSRGGLNLAFAMEAYPQKIEIAVFLTAMMPDTVHPPAYCDQQFVEWYGVEQFLDTQTFPFGDNFTYGVIGPLFLRRLYSLGSPEDLTLAKTLVRPSSTLDLASRGPLSNERYGSVKRAYIIVVDDKVIPVDFQRWNIENSGVAIVKEIQGADHMAMISQPVKVYQALLEIAYSSLQEQYFSLRRMIQI